MQIWSKESFKKACTFISINSLRPYYHNQETRQLIAQSNEKA